MAFSFTPGQIAPQGNQATAAPSTGVPGAALAPVSGPPSTSPFLILRERGQPLSIMACVQIVLFALAVVSVIVSVVLYSYSIYLSSSVEQKKKEIGTKESTFKNYPFEEMRQLTNRFQTIDMLLKAYISPRAPLKLLENVVENEAYFNDFSLNHPPSGYVVDFTVITNNYETLIQQLEALNLKQYTKVAPKPKPNNLQDSTAYIKVKISTPILVQGMLADKIDFLDAATTATTTKTDAPQADSNKP